MPLSRRHLLPCGLLAGLALTGSALGSASHEPAAAPPTVAQAVAAPSAVPPPAAPRARRVSRGITRVPLSTRTVTRTVAAGRTFSGLASWYGGSFQGQRTANGERFDTRELTAASRTLPFGTRLRVCHRSRCVVVRVNDRGPYVGDRILDLSRAARDRLGGFGVARVSVTPVARRRVAVHPAPARRPVAPAVPVRPLPAALPAPQRAAAVPAPAAHSGPADPRGAGGAVLMAGSAAAWLVRRRASAA
jgi:rare lipoprotein A